NEYKLKSGDDTLRAEMIVLRDTLSINTENSCEPQADKFNELENRIDNESNELIASFKQLQLDAKDYLRSLEEKSESSYDLGLKVKNASKVWQQNLQTLAVKLASSQSRILELTAEKEKLVKVNEQDSNRVATLETEIIQLKEELNRHKEHIQNQNGGDDVENCAASQDDEEEEQFVYPVNPEKQEIPESSSQSTENTSQPSPIMATQTIFASDTDSNTSSNSSRSSKNEEDAIRETLIKKHYESKISQLTNQLNSADQKTVQLHKSLKVIQEKLVESENLKLRSEQENVKLQNELSRLKEKLNEDRANYDKQLKEMTGWTEQRQNKIKELGDELSGYEAGTSRNE
ncbi:655_t:CDS:10, partial [Racocetra persica]